jgi:hypothetical protein
VSPQYDLRKATDLDQALTGLRGFWKFWSACLLTTFGLPTLQGIIFTARYPTIRRDINRFFRESGFAEVLIRHDKRPEEPPYPRGGFLVGESLVQDTVDFFFSLGRIVAVYEKADPLLNHYNINLLFETFNNVSAEILGPGFDASDLQRGDLSPHETYEITVSPKGTLADMKLVRRVNHLEYKESVALRKDKVRNKLASAPAPALACRIREDLGIPEDLDTHLEKIRSPLSKADAYKPVPKDILAETVNKVTTSGVINRYLASTNASFPLVFSTSFVNLGKQQVYWDIVSPSLKYAGLKKIKSRNPFFGTDTAAP